MTTKIAKGIATKLGMRVETITPRKAEEWLTRNTHNRPISEGQVKILAGIITDGHWKLNGEPIIFDANGVLLDGQHRLLAVVRSGIAVEMLVVRGAAADSFDTIDRGRMRTIGNLLSIRGESNTKNLAAALSWLYRILNDTADTNTGDKAHRATGTKAFALLDDHPGMRGSLELVQKHCRNIACIGMTAACHYLFHQIDPAAADAFVEKLGTGEGLRKTQGVMLLRARLIGNKGASKKASPSELCALTIKAINISRNGDCKTNLIWKRTEPFPTLK